MFIFRVDCLHTFLPDLQVGWNWLSATANTTARASHYLNKVIRSFSVSYHLHDFISINQSVRNSYLQFSAFKKLPCINTTFNLNSCFFYSIHTSYRGNIQISKWNSTSGNDLISSA